MSEITLYQHGRHARAFTKDLSEQDHSTLGLRVIPRENWTRLDPQHLLLLLSSLELSDTKYMSHKYEPSSEPLHISVTLNPQPSTPKPTPHNVPLSGQKTLEINHLDP